MMEVGHFPHSAIAMWSLLIPSQVLDRLFLSKKEFYKGAQDIQNRGFFIGIHVKEISNKQLKLLETKLLKISEL